MNFHLRASRVKYTGDFTDTLNPLTSWPNKGKQLKYLKRETFFIMFIVSSLFKGSIKRLLSTAKQGGKSPKKL